MSPAPILLALGAALALTPDPVAAPADGGAPPRTARVLTVTARDFTFDAPDSITAGPTVVRLVNAGKELHHAWLTRLDAGHTQAEYVAALRPGVPLPAWAHEVGGPNSPAPGGTSEAVIDLAPGTYVLNCVIPSPDGAPHMMKGMTRTLTVLPARGVATRTANARPARGAADAATVVVPAPDVTMVLNDYNYALSRPLTAGKHVLRVRNEASQPHEVFIARLAPGKTVREALAWIEKMDGPPPLEPVGGTAGMGRGVSNDLILDLAPGEYGLFCFVPDAKDGRPHVAHGMVKQVTVR